MTATQDYLASLAENGRSAHTVLAYGSDLTQLERFLVQRLRSAEVDWRRVKPADLLAFDATLATTCATATRVRKRAALLSFARWLAAAGLVGADPLDRGFPRLAQVKHPPVILSVAEVDRLTGFRIDPDDAADLRDRAMLRLAAATGARVSELVGAELEDLDLASDYLRLRNRDCPFDARTHDALAVYLQAGRPKVARRGSSTALFLNHRGAGLTRQGFWLILRGRARETGLTTPISPHVLRHSLAVRLLADHASTADVQALLGHAHKATTEAYLPLVSAWRRAS